MIGGPFYPTANGEVPGQPLESALPACGADARERRSTGVDGQDHLSLGFGVPGDFGFQREGTGSWGRAR